MRPQVSQALAKEWAQLWGCSAASCSPLAGYDDTNLRLTTAEGQNVVLKAHNAGDSDAASQYAEAQNALLLHLAVEGFPVPAPLQLADKPAADSSARSDGYTLRAAADDGRVHAVRMLSWLPGAMLADVPQSLELYRQLGALLARVNRALQAWHWTATGVLRRQFDWNIMHLHATYHRVRPHLLPLNGLDVPLLDRVVEHFQAATSAAGRQLRQCIIHSDANERNVLVDAAAAAAAAAAELQPEAATGASKPGSEGNGGLMTQQMITGLIDWGDACWQWLAGEPAIAAVYMMLLDANSDAPLPAAAAIVAGYESQLPLLPAERRLLRTLCMGRLAQSLSLGAYAATQQPDNQAYLLGTQKNGWRLLRLLWALGDDAFLDVVCPTC